MKRYQFLIYTLIALLVFGLTACNPLEPDECLVQVSTLKALQQGDYHGVMSVKDLLNYGDFGVGTFDGLDGEMIVLDGICYQALADGSVVQANQQETTPFASLSSFKVDFSVALKDSPNLSNLEKQLTLLISPKSVNCFYLAKITGTFQKVKVRAPHAQSEPYPSLEQVLAKDQEEFTYMNQKGTLVALYCPAYFDGLNEPGWHMHFISEDKTRGGHVLDVSFVEAYAEFDRTDKFYLILPETQDFAKLDLGSVLTKTLLKK